MQKLISIIVATYNSEKTLERCLSSISNQKCDLVEIIVIDGNSKDGTLEILKRFSNSIDIIISEPDQGIYDAWNKGLLSSTGKWVMFVGSDDELRVDCIKHYKEQIFCDDNYDFISGRIMLVNEKGESLREFGLPFEWEKFKHNMNVAHVSSLHNRALYDQYGSYDASYKICADYEFLLRPREKLRAKFVNHILANMAIGGISFASHAALKEAREIKIQHKVDKLVVLWARYLLSAMKLSLTKKLCRY